MTAAGDPGAVRAPLGGRLAWWRRLDDWLFEPAPAERLGVLRILVGAYATLYLALRLPTFLGLADGRGSFEPVGLLWWLDDPLPRALIVGWTIATLLAGIAFTAGRWARATGPAFAVGVLAATTYRSSWGQLLWLENLLVLQLLIIALAPCGDAWGLGPRRREASGEPSLRYGWPIRLAMLVTVATYVLAGVAKLRVGGLAWLWGDTLRNHIAFSAARLELFGEVSSPVGRAVVPYGGWLRPLAILTVLIELAAPVALLGGRVRTWWIALAWSMHVAIAALMFVVFPYPLFGVAFVCFYRLERLPSALARLVSRKRVDPVPTT